MKRTLLIAGILLVLGAIAAAAYVLRPSEQASSSIQATPLPTQAKPTTLPTQAATPTGAAQPTTQPAPTESNAKPAAPGELTGSFTYQIIQEESQVRFSIDEILRGNPFTAVGVTNQVAGELALDFDNKVAQLGTVQVNARTLKTDSSFRDRAIKNEILDTAQYEYITFEPTAITGLPSTGAIGETFTFQITGNLTIRNITQEVAFDVTVTLVSLERLEGRASATVLRSDYQLVIPSVPSVADVSEQVLIEIDFVAVVK